MNLSKFKPVFLAVTLQLLCLYTLTSQRTISGIVTNEGGEPLIGASIFTPGTSIGTISDVDGSYALEVPDEVTHLTFSFLGFQQLSVEITEPTLNVVLRESSSIIDEVLIVGYGSTSKKTLTDNVAKIGADQLDNIPISNFQSAISGKAAGVRVTPTNGKVDGALNIDIRGVPGLNARARPLYVLDGVPLLDIPESLATGSALNPLISLSATEIESIEILKDASSAAIYGARGANGVVLITTKSGKAGKSKISLNVSSGISSPTNVVEFLNTDQYLELYREAAEFQPWGPAFIESQFELFSVGNEIGSIDTDWNDVVFRTGTQSNMDFSLSGGDDKTTYYIGGAYNDTKGIIIGNDLERITARVNVKHKFSKLLTAGMNMGYSNTSTNRVADDGSFLTPLQAIAQSPLSPPRLPDGSPNSTTLYPNFLLENDFASTVSGLRRLTGKFYGEFKFSDRLKFNSDFGYDFNLTSDDNFRGSQTPFNSTNGEAFVQSAVGESVVWSNYLTYLHTLSESSLINVVAGMEYTEANRSVNNVRGTQFPSDDLTTIINAAEITDGLGFESKYTFLSYFTRASLSLSDKYFIKGSIRRDGSSRFGANNRFGIFPSLSVGWLLTGEPIFANIQGMSHLKLRASYGQLGNAEIGDFPSQYLFRGVSYNQLPGLDPFRPGNPDLSWETSTQFDIGLEFGFFNDRVSGEVDYYSKRIDDILLNVPLPGSAGSGAGIINQNVGAMITEGVEVVVNTDILSTPDFKWTTSANVAFTDSEITALPNEGADINFLQNSILRVGEEPFSFNLPEYAGVDPDNGDALYYVNSSEDDLMTTNNIGEANRVIAGQSTPEIIAGWTNRLTYKGLDFEFTFVGEWGASIFNFGGPFQSANANFEDNQTIDQLNRWQNPGDITDVPEARLFGFNGNGESTRWLERADFIRLRNLSLGYEIPSSLLSKVNIESARIHITGTNLLTFTDYTGYDPEARADIGSEAARGGFAFYSAPLAKTVVLGINLNF